MFNEKTTSGKNWPPSLVSCTIYSHDESIMSHSEFSEKLVKSILSAIVVQKIMGKINYDHSINQSKKLTNIDQI